MKVKSGKNVDPNKLQSRVLTDLQKYQEGVRQNALKSKIMATETVDLCCICGNSERDFLLSVYDFDYWKCRTCSHVYLGQRLPAIAMHDFYEKNKDYSGAYTNKDQLLYRLNHVAKPKVDWIMTNLETKATDMAWLDVGCAIGDVITAVETHKGWQGIGLDISADSVALGEKMYKVDLRQQQFRDFSSQNPDQKFDVISFFGYLGLVNDPLTELQLAKKHLKKKGYIVIGEENAASISTQVQQFFPQFSSRHLLPPMTVSQFTLKSITAAFEEIDCELMATWNFGLDFYEFLKMIALSEKGFDQSHLFKSLMKNLNALQKTIDRQGMGDYILTIGQVR